MQKNIGPVDKSVRILVALTIIVLLILGEISGLAAIVLGILAAAFLTSGTMGTCPLYIPFKLNTLGRKKKS